MFSLWRRKSPPVFLVSEAGLVYWEAGDVLSGFVSAGSACVPS